MDSSSCGFYITADNADKRLPQDEQCGGLFCEITHFTCSSNYNISFSCTNATYLDTSGNAQCVTIFVATDCYSNERLPPGEQDPRYDTSQSNVAVLETMFQGVINATEQAAYLSYYDPNSYPNSWPNSYPNGYGTPDPAVLPTCLRGCLCGYLGGKPDEPATVDASVYSYCTCAATLPHLFGYLASTLRPEGTIIYTTPTNLTLLVQSAVEFEYFNATLTDMESGTGTPVWINISEGSNLTLQKEFECFGDYESISEIMPPSYP